jgi:hypothetical protein
MNEALIADPVRSKQILERIPAGRWGTPDDFEGAIVYLASRASDYVSGECLVVDGGWMGRESESFLKPVSKLQTGLNTDVQDDWFCTIRGFMDWDYAKTLS